jgi:hypothetical protein
MRTGRLGAMNVPVSGSGGACRALANRPFGRSTSTTTSSRKANKLR